jgi:hypothetical protein
MNPSVMSINISSAVGVTAGGTGLTTIPTNGQLLIGNGTGYTLNTLGFGAGISVTNGSGTITVANTGVLSFSAGTTGLTPSAAITGAIVLAGTLNVANGGTGVSTATANTVFAGPTAGANAPPSFRGLVVADIPALPYAPQTSGTSILYGNSTGGFSNVTIGAGISFVSGTLSATGAGGTVTSVGGTGTVNGLTLTGTVTSSGNLTLGGTLNLSSPPAIGGTAAAAGTFTTLIGGADVANYGQLTGGATTKAVEFKSLGTDTNVAFAIRSKGTGAIDLAAGSSGVNISNGGTVTAITRTNGGTGYTVAPTVVISAPTTAGGVQATATCTVTAGVVDTAFTITNAGSGYVEQPTITFTPVSGGTGAAAYAIVGSATVLKTVGGYMAMLTPGGEAFRVADSARTTVNLFQAVGSSTGVSAALQVIGADSSINGIITSKNTGYISLQTNTFGSEALRAAHTASAVNYVQVTGATTASKVVAISAQGSDADVTLSLSPKGAGTIRFGTYTGTVLTPTGYITITDSGGTSRRLLVG